VLLFLFFKNLEAEISFEKFISKDDKGHLSGITLEGNPARDTLTE
jgi:hypothetical protein